MYLWQSYYSYELIMINSFNSDFIIIHFYDESFSFIRVIFKTKLINHFQLDHLPY